MDGALHIGEAIRRGRRDKKLTQKELAKILGVSPALVSFWENHTRGPSGEELLKIARYLDIVHLLFPDYEVRKRDRDVAGDDQYPLMLREEIARYRRENQEIRQVLQKLQQKIDSLVE